MQEIVDAVTRLFLATDDRDWGAVQECFADEVVFSMAGSTPETKTPDAISGMWETTLDPIEALHHQVGNFVVKTQGDAADVFCYGIAYHYKPTRSGRNTRVFVGSYDLHLARVQGEWKIDQFRFNLKFVDGNVDLDRE
jgi:3-phenylpropionate/cinnamic acid dioxygenase small subunit